MKYVFLEMLGLPFGSVVVGAAVVVASISFVTKKFKQINVKAF